jgi:integrase/recombinase XerD
MRRGVRPPVKLPRVHRVRGASGTLHRYHRVTRARLPDGIPEDHADFLAAWMAEEAKGTSPARKPHAPEGTIAAGCIAYLASTSYAELSTGYRPTIRRHVEAIRERGDTAKMTDLRRRHVQYDLEPLTPPVAAARLKAWRKLACFWQARGWISEDPTEGVRRKPLAASDGHREWTFEDLEQFRAHWPVGTTERLAAELLQWTGARTSDLVTLGPAMVRGTLLTFRQQKTGAEAYVPWRAIPGHEADWRHLAAALSTTRGFTWMETRQGRVRSHKAVSSWFSAAATAAGLPDHSAHGLRKYRMNRLAETGATVIQMQSWCGHVTLQEVEHYTRRANRRGAFDAPGEQIRGVIL